MPPRSGNWCQRAVTAGVEVQVAHHPREQRLQRRQVAQAIRRASVRVYDPLSPGHGVWLRCGEFYQWSAFSAAAHHQPFIQLWTILFVGGRSALQSRAMVRGLVVRFGGAGLRYHALTEEQVTIGRSASSTLAFPESHQISRQHAAIRKHEQGWVLIDLGSRNGTLLNGVRVEGEVSLAAGDTIGIGDLSIEITGEESPSVPAVLSDTTRIERPPAPPDTQILEFPGSRGVLSVPDPTPFAYGRSSVLFRATGDGGTALVIKLFRRCRGIRGTTSPPSSARCRRRVS